MSTSPISMSAVSVRQPGADVISRYALSGFCANEYALMITDCVSRAHTIVCSAPCAAPSAPATDTKPSMRPRATA